MGKRFAIKKLFHLMCVSGIISLSTNAMASAFQLFEQDGASIGNYHAGRSAEAADASTAFYNPAGITRIHNQQIVIGDVGILSDVKYRGTVAPAIIIPPPIGITAPVGVTQNAVAQGGSFSQVPNFYYVAPLTERLGFGLSLNAPFGLRTDYGADTALRYAATKSQLQVIDLSPSLGFNVTERFSIGAGVDVQRAAAEFDQVGTIGTATDSYSTTKGWSTAVGYHLGALFQFNPDTRIGLAYNSQVTHNLSGTSRLTGPIANIALGIPLGTPATIYSGNTKARLILPAYTTLSGFHRFNDKWALMGTVMYTQWSVIQNITLENAAAAVTALPLGIPTPVPSTTTNVVLPTHYRNTWNVSVGANYYATEQFMLRTGVGYDQTPVQNTYRDVRIPDNNRVAIAFGGHYQATKALGFDLGWTHLFLVGDAKINPPPAITGGQSVTTNGTVQGSADVFGAQVKWDIA